MKTKWGALMVDGRGKIGGQVASKNRSGSYMRNKVTPSNPNTAAQVAVRNMLSTASSAWSSLTNTQRAGWDGAVNDWVGTNVFGDVVKPTGKNLFTKLNINLMNIGGNMIADVPIKSSVPPLDIVSVEYDLSSSEITILNTQAVSGYEYLVSATAPQSAGTSFFRGKFRNIYHSPAPQNFSTVVWNAYVEKFGELTADSNVMFEIKLVDTTTGQVGLPVTIPVVIVP